VQKVLEGVNIFSQMLPGWRVHGIIACYAPDARLGRFVGRPEVRVWSLEHAAFLLQADTYDQIAGMLWTTPGSLIPRLLGICRLLERKERHDANS
jgi:hypothetical protein